MSFIVVVVLHAMDSLGVFPPQADRMKETAMWWWSDTFGTMGGSSWLDLLLSDAKDEVKTQTSQHVQEVAASLCDGDGIHEWGTRAPEVFVQVLCVCVCWFWGGGEVQGCAWQWCVCMLWQTSSYRNLWNVACVCPFPPSWRSWSELKVLLWTHEQLDWRGG